MPGKINSLGIGSGVLNNEVIDKLRAADESALVAPIDRKLKLNIDKQKELAELNAKVSEFKTPTSGLADYATYIARKATASSDAISANVRPGVPLQDIKIDVKSLASNDINEVGKKFSSRDDIFSNEDVSLNLFSNGKHYLVEVKAGMSLADVAQAITDKSEGNIIGIAMKVGGELPYQLVINSKETGENSRIYFGSTLATRQVKTLGNGLNPGDLDVILKDKYFADKVLNITISPEEAKKKSKTEVLYDAIKKAMGEDEDLKELVDSNILSIGLSKDHSSIILNDRRGYAIEFSGSRLNELGIEHTASKLDELLTTGIIPEGAQRGKFTIGSIPFDLEDITQDGNSSEDNAKALAAAIENIAGIHARADRNAKIHIESEIGELNVSSQTPGGEEFIKKIGLKDKLFKNYLALQNDTFNFRKLSLASDSKIVINGKEISRDTNKINDLVNGVDITLNETTKEGEPVILRITQDKEAITSKLEEFVKSYNDLRQKLDEQTRYDADSKIAGIFNGESDVRSIRPSINSLITQSIYTKDNEAKSLVDYGLSLNDKSVMVFDMQKINQEFDKNPEKVTEIFYGYDKKLQGRDIHTDGAFVKLDNYIKSLSDEKTGRLGVFDSALSREAKTLDRDKKSANERLDSRYNLLAQRFGAYDEQIAKANNSFNAVQMMIDQSVAKKK
ncbi:MAG: flagellar filament capping protein FliD [Helicobacter sp.]|nr:flagellar filament capping protein FliD [Helicobacter sp.]